MSLTPQHVVDFWAYMSQEFGSTVKMKADSEVMQAAAVLLDALDIQDREQFMKLFVTTLYKTIYIPFTIGDETEWALWSQIRVCVHEHQHIVQGEREGWPLFCGRYLTDSSFRAGYEAEAYGCDLEMDYWRTSQLMDIDARVASLQNYGCKPEDIEQARQALTIRAAVVLQGVIETESAMKAINWLETHVPELAIGL